MLKKYSKIVAIIAFILLLVSIPFIINEAYKTHSGYIVMWNAADMLGFYGSVLSGLLSATIAIVGVYLTLKENRKLSDTQIKNIITTTEATLKENRDINENLQRLSVLPLITISKVQVEINNFTLASLLAQMLESQNSKKKYIPIEDNSEYYEYKLDEMALVFDNGGCHLCPHLNDAQKELIKKPFDLQMHNGSSSVGKIRYIYSPFYFSNAGVGAAINLTISFFQMDRGNKYMLSSQPFNIMSGDSLKVSIFADDISHIGCSYKIIIRYSDIHNCKYKQEHFITIDHKKIGIELNAEVDQKND